VGSRRAENYPTVCESAQTSEVSRADALKCRRPHRADFLLRNSLPRTDTRSLFLTSEFSSKDGYETPSTVSRSVRIMARFLTPSKIGILALIELYTCAIVPTSATIPVLSFIIDQVLPSKSPSIFTSSSQNLPFILDLKSFETLLAGHPSASGLPGRTLWDYFLKKLWDIDSLDALHIFFEESVNLLVKPRDELKKDGEIGIPPPSPDMIVLSRTSPFGSFVRRAKVEFDRLQFNDSRSLWTAFVRWRQDTVAYWARRNGGLRRWAGDKALSEGELQWGAEATEMLEIIAYDGLLSGEVVEGTVSTDDAEKLLEFQVEQMQSMYWAS
jgi:anaphase-promoting complex subunit 5